MNGIKFKRGQSTRSNTNLPKDIGYREFRGEKRYLKSTINRWGEKLMKGVGTLSSLLNMTKYKQKDSLIFFLFSSRNGGRTKGKRE
ncbi:hypothetical protein [Mesobacillus foraminis]|uniref:hypothetical protein n=1 Tax=Mesobacillus foraminis TaxID=279826 RepID=UPI0010484994|nr:hypothetical protein [Mesobacillus foraminis]